MASGSLSVANTRASASASTNGELLANRDPYSGILTNSRLLQRLHPRSFCNYIDLKERLSRREAQEYARRLLFQLTG